MNEGHLLPTTSDNGSGSPITWPMGPTRFTIQNEKGQVLLEIPTVGGRFEYTPDEMFEIIALQTKDYWYAKFQAETIERLDKI